VIQGFKFVLIANKLIFVQEFVRALNARSKDEIDDGKSTRFGVLDRFKNKRKKK